MLKRDVELRRIIEYIAKNPGCSLYQIGSGSGVNRITTIRKIKSQYKLVENGLLSVKPGKRNAENCWLTYKGLVFALKIGALTPKKAHEVRVNHKIQLPNAQFGDLDLTPLLYHVEENFPQFFYDYYCRGVADLTLISDKLLAGLTGAMAVLTLSELYSGHPERVQNFIEGKNYILPNGTVYEDIATLLSTLRMFGFMFSGKP